MFGIRKQTGSKFGGGYGAMESPYGTPPIAAPMAQEGAAAPAPEPRKPGFFKPGGGGQYVLAALADTLARQMDEQPTAVAGILEGQQRAQELAEQQRQASTQREHGWQDWLRKQEWERENPKPASNDTVADYEFIRQRLGDSAGETFLRNKVDPPRYALGKDGQYYRIDQPRVDAPDTLPADFDFGGPASAPGTFPGSGY